MNYLVKSTSYPVAAIISRFQEDVPEEEEIDDIAETDKEAEEWDKKQWMAEIDTDRDAYDDEDYDDDDDEWYDRGYDEDYDEWDEDYESEGEDEPDDIAKILRP